MKLRPVQSTSIAAIGYDERRSRLLIQFRDTGDIYAYDDVPPHVFRDLQEAPSKGRYVNYEIKGRYRYEKVETGVR
jgi:hypothetical protein